MDGVWKKRSSTRTRKKRSQHGLQTFFTHHSVSTFDRFPFQLTDELLSWESLSDNYGPRQGTATLKPSG
jgi:hypothetical protein|eukprot:29501-Pelagococcus_subviridis.AAC.7